jgi:hypothetical protein
MTSTTVSPYLPAIISALSSRLPVELIERILTRLPLSAILELSIVEDELLQQNTETARARGHLSQCILGSLGWRRVFPDRDTLLGLTNLFRLITEAYELVYCRPFSHAAVARKKTGINENSFQPLRTILSKQTRQLGPAHQVLLQHLYLRLSSQYAIFIRKVWKSMKNDWHNYMCSEEEIAQEDGHIRSLGVGVPKVWHRDWVNIEGNGDILQTQLRFMVFTERIYRKQLGNQLKHHSELLERNPGRLKKLGDFHEQPRPNIHHVIERLDQDARDITNLNFAARRKNKGVSRFRNAHLPVLPLDKWMWFFLECRARIGTGFEPDPPSHTIIADMDIVVSGLSHILIGTEGSNFSMKSSKIPRLAFRFQDRTKVDLNLTNHLQERFLNGRERRPVFTTRRGLWSGFGLAAPHDEREIRWLDAFLRCCEQFSKMFPELLAGVEQEARKDYLSCPVAEKRSKLRKAEAHIAATLSLKGAKYEMLVGK